MGPEKQMPEVMCSSCANPPSGYSAALITSGGGFSEIFPRPSFQGSAVQSYLNSNVTFPTAFYNQTNRVIPDIGLLGHKWIAWANPVS